MADANSSKQRHRRPPLIGLSPTDALVLVYRDIGRRLPSKSVEAEQPSAEAEGAAVGAVVVPMYDTPPQFGENGQLILVQNNLYVYADGWKPVDAVGGGIITFGTDQTQSAPNSFYFNTTNNRLYININGTIYHVPYYAEVGYGTSFPSNAEEGCIFYKTDENKFYQKRSGTWVSLVPYPTTFLGLTDTPSSYSGQGGKFVAVKTTEDGLEFVAAPSGSIQYGTSFPSNPTNGQVFYRTDTTTLYQYQGTQWVRIHNTIEVRSSSPSPAVAGRIWLTTGSPPTIRVQDSGGTERVFGALSNSNGQNTNRTSGSAGSSNEVSRADHTHAFSIYDWGAGTITLNSAIGIVSAFPVVLYVNSGGALVQIPATFPIEITDEAKSVSSGNNNIIAVRSTTTGFKRLNFRIELTETTKSDFYCVLPVVLPTQRSDRLSVTTLRLRLSLYVFSTWASFTHHFAVTFTAYDTNFSSLGSITVNNTIATNSSGYGYNEFLGNLSIGVNYSPVHLSIRITRRRSLEATGTPPNDCYVYPVFSIRNY